MNKYIIKPGDSWIKIANDHGISLNDLFYWNGVDYRQEPPIIHPGTSIYISDPYKITAAVVQADAPKNYVDYKQDGRRMLDSYATAVRNGQMRFNEVPEPFRTPVYQRMINQGQGEFAENALNVGINTGLFLLDPIGYTSGFLAHKGLAYGVDKISGRNEYDMGDFLGNTPIMGRQFQFENPITSATVDGLSGIFGGGLIRNARTLLNPNFYKSYLANMKNIGSTFVQRQQLPMPQISGVAPATGHVFKAGTKGIGKSGNVVKGNPSVGYRSMFTPKATFNHSASYSNSGIPTNVTRAVPTPTTVPAMPTLYPAYGPINIPTDTPPRVTVYRPQQHIYEQQSFNGWQLPNPTGEVGPYIPGTAVYSITGKAPIGPTVDSQALTNESINVWNDYLPRTSVYVPGTIEGTPSNIHSGLGIVYDSNNPGTLIIK